MSRQVLARALQDATRLTRAEAEIGVRALLETIERRLFEEGEFSLSGVGRLERRRIPARGHRNPRTGEKIMLAERTRVLFRASPSLRARLHIGTMTPPPA